MPPISRPPDWRLPDGVTPDLWDYLHSGEMSRQYEASLTGSPVLAAEEEFLARHLPETGRLLDLGCGTGRHLRCLAGPGRQVIGIDLSEPMLRQAAASVAEPLLLRANLTLLTCLPDGCADAALCLYSTLGLIQPAAARQRVVAEARRLLRPGGVFLLHVHNRLAAWSRPGQRRWLVADLARSSWTGREAGNWTMPAHQGLARLTMHLFTPGELTRLLRSAGFAILEMRPVGLGPGGRLAWPWLAASWRADGWLVAARAASAGQGARR